MTVYVKFDLTWIRRYTIFTSGFWQPGIFSSFGNMKSKKEPQKMFHSNLEQERILIKKLKQLGHVYGKPDLPILLHFWLILVMAVFLPLQEQMTDLSVFGIKTNNVS